MSVNYSLLVLSFIYFTILLVILRVEVVLHKKDFFSPGRIHVYFSLLPGIGLLWFSFDSTVLFEEVMSSASEHYKDSRLLVQVYSYSILITIVTYLGICIGSMPRYKIANIIFDKIFGLTIFGGRKNKRYVFEKRFWCGTLIYCCAIASYVVFLSEIGGVTNLWQNLNQRVELAAGLGYLQMFYTFSLFFGSILLLSYYFERRNYFKISCIILLSLFVLASLGQRSPVAEFLYVVLVLYHYQVSRFKAVFKIKYLALVTMLIVFMLGSVQFRQADAVERYLTTPSELLQDSLKTFEKHVIARFGRIERDMVILGYFESHDFWYGASYYSLVTAPIPSSIYPNKPPIDTGRYLLAMAAGESIYPPVSVRDLPPSSWPDGNWAGYMNFYWPGLVLTCLSSGFILGFLYQYLRSSNFMVGAVALYAMSSWLGAPSLSPMGAVTIMTSSALFLIWCFVCRLNFSSLFKSAVSNNH
jgi:hypothetical protein